MTEAEKSTLQNIKEKHIKAYNELIERHGHGVRARWVSADLAEHQEQILRARKALGEIK